MQAPGDARQYGVRQWILNRVQGMGAAMERPFDLLAVDLDGTLLNSQHALSEATRVALHRVHELGVTIVLCTGRAFTETRPVIAQIGLELDVTVTVFGALVTDVATGQTIERTPIAPDVARDVTAWFTARHYPVLWLNDPNEAGHDGYLINGRDRHEAVDRWLERTPCDVSQVDQVPPAAQPPLRLSIIHEADVLDRVSVALRSAFDGRLTHNVLHAPPYRLSLIESFAPHVNKWYGIRRLCERWGIDPRRTLAVGDDVNDIAMIRGAGLGVAMANAKPAVRDVADRLTASNDEDGVARLLDELFAA